MIIVAYYILLLTFLWGTIHPKCLSAIVYNVGRVNLHSCPSLTLQESPERLAGCCQKQSSRTRAEESVGVSAADKSLLGSESSFLIESEGDSEYLPTSQKEFRRSLKPVEVPSSTV